MPGSEYLKSIVLGIVQGIAEFLPISSSGHLVILQEPIEKWLGLKTDDAANVQLNIALHVGTLLSILYVYRSEWGRMLASVRTIAAATLPIVITGFILKFWLNETVETAFNSPLLAAPSLLGTAGLLFLAHRTDRGERTLESMDVRTALVIGIFQALALVPGISRSGSTIAAGCLLGLRRDAAANFSFFIAVPAIVGAATVSARDLVDGIPDGVGLGVLGAGVLTSFVVGLFALRLLLRMISQHRLHWFAWYCVAAATVTILWQLAG